MDEKQLADIVRKVLEDMTGGAAKSAPAAAKPSTASAGIPKTARVAMLVEKEKYEIKEYPLQFYNRLIEKMFRFLI